MRELVAGVNHYPEDSFKIDFNLYYKLLHYENTSFYPCHTKLLLLCRLKKNKKIKK